MQFKDQGKRARMDAFVCLCSHLNQREVIGIMHYMLELKPTTSSDSLVCCLNVLRMAARLSLKDRFPEEISIMQEALPTQLQLPNSLQLAFCCCSDQKLLIEHQRAGCRELGN